MTALERAARAARDDAAIYGADLTVDQAAHVVRAVLMAVRDCPIEVRHLTTFEFAETKWPELIDAILNEKDTTNG